MATTTAPKKGFATQAKTPTSINKGMIAPKILGTGAAAKAATSIQDYNKRQKAALDAL